MRIQIINGPNLNLLGMREPEIYGNKGFDGYLQELRSAYPEVQIEYYQSNVEGELINKLHEVGFSCDGIVLNAGAYTHYSIALHDAIKAISSPVVEVHSAISAACVGVICGFGLNSYRLAIEALVAER